MMKRRSLVFAVALASLAACSSEPGDGETPDDSDGFEPSTGSGGAASRPGAGSGGRAGSGPPTGGAQGNDDNGGRGGSVAPGGGGSRGEGGSGAGGGPGGSAGAPAGGSAGTAGSSGGAAGAPGSSGNQACSKTLEGSRGTIPVCCAPTGGDKDMVNQVLQLLNQHRASQGKAALKLDPKLEEAMQGHVRHMVERNFFSHTAPEPDVARFDARARLCGTTAGGENIASGQRTAEAVMNSWKNSSGHNANMLGNYTRVGIGFYQGRWGQIFGR